jgi:hypothetical protein
MSGAQVAQPERLHSDAGWPAVHWPLLLSQGTLYAVKGLGMGITTEQGGVVFHIDSAPLWNLLLANVENLLGGWRGPLAVEVLANGPAVEGLTNGSDARSKVERLSARGVKFLACSKSLRTHGILSERLLPQVEVVAAGVVHLAVRQLAGWAYIKP